jgi:hypothetical protein
MNIYQRPLFRQAGGPIAPEMGPMMPPQGMPPAPMAAPQMMPPQGLDPRAAEAVGQVEQGAAMQAEQYGQNMMAGLDAAETPEEVINAMRGNQRPLEARYGELAELVGQEDAQRTPETVLALLQPVMMMTEQGAMDSGIGELMGQLTGNIDMMDESGAPTEMGQGVGSLMMAGVGQQPVANFSQGGAVQRFQVGGEASRLQELYSEMLPVYQGVMGGGEDQRDLTKAQIFFDIADRFGAFAAGIDPRTGERMQGSAAAQFGAAASGLGGQIGERLGAQDQQERALRVAALQGAAGEFSAERADERAAARAAAAAAANRGIGNAYEAVDTETGEVIATAFLANRDQFDAFVEANPGATIRVAVPEDRITDSDFFTKFGFTEAEFYALPIDEQRRLRGLETTPSGEFIKIRMPGGEEFTVRSDSAKADSLTAEGGQRVAITAAPDAGITDSDFFAKFGFTKEEFYALPIDEQRRLRGLETTPSGEFIKIRMPGGEEFTVRSDSAEADSLTAEGGQRVAITAAPDAGITDSDFFAKFGFTKEEFYALPIDEQRRLRGLETTPSGEFIKIRMPGGEEFTVRSDSAEADSLTAEGGQRVAITAAKILDPLLNVDLLNRIEFGTATPEEYAIFENAVVNPYVRNAEGQMVMGQLAPSILEMQARMAIRGKPTVLPPNGAQLAPYVERLKTLMDAQGLRSVDEIGFNLGAPPRTFQEIVSPVMLKRLEQDARSAFGPNAALREFANLGVGAIPVVDFDAIAPITQKVVADVNSVNLAMEMVVRNMSVGKLDAAGVERFVATLPAPASFTISPDAAAARAEATVGFLQNQVNAAKAGLDTQTGEDRQKLETAIFQGEQGIKFYMALVEGIKGAPMSAAEIQKAIDAAKVEELRNMLPNGN